MSRLMQLQVAGGAAGLAGGAAGLAGGPPGLGAPGLGFPPGLPNGLQGRWMD